MSSPSPHWKRLRAGALLATSPRIDWPTLLQRTYDVDVLRCAKCAGRLRPIAVITDRDTARGICAALELPTEPPPLARARDPTDEPVHLDVNSSADAP
jgi:hypothetical protein